ncbi:hypothetical protein ACFE04_001062 [Oxalis oulophora]
MGLFPISSIDYENKTLAIARPIRRKLEEDGAIVHKVSFGVEIEENQVCDDCDKNQTCSLEIKCMCHPKDCKDNAIDDGINAGLNKIVNEGRSINHFSTSLLAMLSFIVGISLLHWIFRLQVLLHNKYVNLSAEILQRYLLLQFEHLAKIVLIRELKGQ